MDRFFNDKITRILVHKNSIHFVLTKLKTKPKERGKWPKRKSNKSDRFVLFSHPDRKHNSF